MNDSHPVHSAGRHPDAKPSDKVLQAACWGTVLFGAALLLAPGPARQGFSLLIFGEPGVIDAWPEAARRYATLLHGVLGAVMVGWGVALLLALRPEPGTTPRGWRVVAVSVACWYVPDSVFSLALGAWQNAVLNTVLAAAFAAGLALARGRAQPRPA